MIDSEQFYTEIGILIKNKRIEKGISQEILADQLSLTRASIINLEKSRHKPSLYQLLLISEVLQVSYIELIPEYKEQTVANGEEFNIDTAVTDQEKIDESTQAVLRNFFSSIKSSV